MTEDQIKEIDEVFNTFAKKDKSGKKVPNAQLNVRPDLNNAMR